MTKRQKVYMKLLAEDGCMISEPAEAGKFRRVDGCITNASEIRFATPSSAGQARITHFAVFTSKGGILADGPLEVPVVVDQFTQPCFPEGALTIDNPLDDFFDIEEDEDPCEPICQCRYCGGTARDTLDRCIGCGAPNDRRN